MTAGAVIVAAGRGERFGDLGKVMANVAGQPMLAWSLDTIETVGAIRDVVIVVGDHTEASVRDLVRQGPWSKVLMIVLGGSVRQASVQAGVRVLPDDIDTVVIHDAARPLADADVFEHCIATAHRTGAAIAAAPVTDTLKRIGPDGLIVETVDRTPLWAAQTPQAFNRERLLEAFAHADVNKRPVTDEAMLFEQLRWPVHIVPGSRGNLKVTVPEDLAVAEFLLQARERRT
jgi:2-C-methyl-D-erythritol 4-phosphate cytidylyltransferase